MPKKLTLEEIKDMLLKTRDYVQWGTRTTAWRRAYFEHNPPYYCSMCERKSYCKRLSWNGMVQDMIFRGEICPDVWTIWNRVFQ